MSVTKTMDCEHYVVRKSYEWASIVVRRWSVDEGADKVRHCGEILIHSSYGSWANSWGHCGVPFKRFLIGADFDYVFTKFMGNSLQIFDDQGSVKKLRARVIDYRKQGDIDKEEARAVWDGIEDEEAALECSEREFVDAVYRIVRDVDSGRVQRMFAEPWELTAKCYDHQATGFWRELWPEFKATLIAETAEAVPA